MSDYHEPPEELSDETRNYTRALNSMKEELEAIAWYQHRIDSSDDEALKKILTHNRDEEMEHACMVMEWMRRNMPGWDEKMKTYFFTEGEITELESGSEDDSDSDNESLGIGKPE